MAGGAEAGAGAHEARAEASTPLLASLPPEANVTSLLEDRVAATPGAELFSRRTEAGWEPVSAAEFHADVVALARGLIASGLDVGDRVAIVSASSYGWALVDFAIWYAGGVPVPVYETSSPSQIAYILADSGVRRVFVENSHLALAVQEAISSSPELGNAWLPITLMTEDGGGGSNLTSLAGPGLGVPAQELERHRTAADLDSLATLVYTSGTTGRPKGCEITHRNLALLAVNLQAHLPEVVGPGARTLMFLPLAHVLARAVQITCVAAGVVVGHSRQSTLLDDLATFRPTFLLAVPRVFEKVYAAAEERAEGVRGSVFERAAATAREFSRALDEEAAGRREGPGRRLRLRHAVFDRLVYGRLRAAFGGRVSTIVSGGSALSPALAHFFRGAGLTVLEGYGLTETTAPCTVNTPQATRIGTVGRPVPGTTVRIDPTGEVLVKGIGVIRGYRGGGAAAPGGEGPASAFREDGFFATGDLGSLDAEGFLTITGRLKDVLVTAGGKNVAPGPLEEALRESELVAHAVVVGEGRPFVAALLALDGDQLGSWARRRGRTLSIAEAAGDPEVLAELQQAVDAANAAVSRAESIRRFVVLPRELTLEDGDLTPSLKLRRQRLVESFPQELEDLYSA
ncbi:long-chain fatty acid--CoA ligase [Sinomonas atrocyanea]|uniref:Long-chain fatty acid--CoA ligase n=1 Tax=Sinomonas atrocyanea TaxID=37927 RepID=A0A126ZZV2_9MICC|nr:AMP-dependent synthetase/ligase [Sinomonas atrocyanea]AMM32131.1 long-chain fatty acid--CoA ligase [Sinomonas atrocyanea]GEB66178.1 long-chain acyl-CoA synthetase [Sinomonas atrocyanea]GGG55571.1 long-chain acyl-CoA synthetase [Sinomonas atrocyanea]